jgi:hypothetical protein
MKREPEHRWRPTESDWRIIFAARCKAARGEPTTEAEDVLCVEAYEACPRRYDDMTDDVAESCEVVRGSATGETEKT